MQQRQQKMTCNKVSTLWQGCWRWSSKSEGGFSLGGYTKGHELKVLMGGSSSIATP